MSSDPKGPTPLSAEAESFRAQFDRWLGNESEIVDRFIALVREQDATMDAQATEIAALKEEITKADKKFLEVEASWEKRQNALLSEIAALRGALAFAKEWCPDCRGTGCLRWSLPECDECPPAGGCCTKCRVVRRVLAGKEAQS